MVLGGKIKEDSGLKKGFSSVGGITPQSVKHTVGLGQSSSENMDGFVKTDSNGLYKIIDGDKFNDLAPPHVNDPVVAIPGMVLGEKGKLSFDGRMLSTHVAMIGGIGTGKSNTFYHIIDQVKNKISNNDIMVIFDTKGDFLNCFGKGNDIVISNDQRAHGMGCKDYWNIFEEIDPEDVDASIRELSSSIFKEAIKHSSNSFFPNAAADLFYGIMYLHYERWEEIKGRKPNNEDLINWIRETSPSSLYRQLDSYPRLKAVASYISNPNSGQTQGVIAEMHAVLNRLFVGNFVKNGTLSMTNLVKQRGGFSIFIEYDLKTGDVLSPIYSLLVDLALKQSLSNRTGHKGSVYLFVDEFKLLPNLNHIDDAVNFGRSLGVKVFIALQSITQMYDNYGVMKAKSILSGFLNYIFFNVNNAESKEFIKEYFGKNIAHVSYSKGDQIIQDYVVKDKDILRLSVGETIIGLQNVPPFVFKFDEWKSH